jgi:PAS domain S-box-containing protein
MKETVFADRNLETLHDGYFETDLQGRFTICNPGFCRLMGYSNQELIGRNFRDFMADENIAQLEADLKKQGLFQESCEFLECEARHWDGTVMILEAIVSPVTDPAGKWTGFRGLARDVSEHRRRQQYQLYVSKMKSLARLTGGIAHDFNNLLYVIMGNAELIQDRIPEDCRQKVDKILSTCVVCADIIKKLMQFSFPGEPKKQLIELNQFILSEMKRFQNLMAGNIRFETGLEDQSLYVFADPSRMEAMLSALLINAVEAVGEQSGTVILKLENVRLRERPVIHYPGLRPGHYARIVVHDNGSGIPASDLYKIFDPYFSTKKFVHGAGLGLSMVHGIVNECRGTITVESYEGKGTTFRVLLPLVDMS